MKSTLKTLALSAAFAGLCMASVTAPASATPLIPKGQSGTAASAVFAPVLLVDSATGQTGQTGLAGTATVTVELPGATSYIAATGTFSEAGGGNYKYFPSASETATAGILWVRVVASGAVQSDGYVQIVGFDPASDLGAAALAGITTTTSNTNARVNTGLPNVAPGTAGGVVTADASNKVAFNNTSIPTVGSVTNPVVASSVTNPVSVTGKPAVTLASTDLTGTLSVNLNAGQSVTATNFVAPPTVVQIRQEMDANSTRFASLALNLSQPILFDVSGNVKGSPQTPVMLASVQSYNNTGQTTPPAWLGNTSVLLAGEQAKLLAASTAQQTGQAVTLPPPPTGYGGSGGTFTLTQQNISDIAAAVMQQNVDGNITLKGVQQLLLAYSFNPYSRTKIGSTMSLVYQNRAGQPLATTVSGLDPLGNVLGRTSVTFTNLPQ